MGGATCGHGGAPWGAVPPHRCEVEALRHLGFRAEDPGVPGDRP